MSPPSLRPSPAALRLPLLLLAVVCGVFPPSAAAQCESAALQRCPAVIHQNATAQTDYDCASFLAFEACAKDAGCAASPTYLGELAVFDTMECKRPRIRSSITTEDGNIVLTVREGRDVIVRRGGEGEPQDVAMDAIDKRSAAAIQAAADALTDAKAYADTVSGQAEVRSKMYADAASATAQQQAEEAASESVATLENGKVQDALDGVVRLDGDLAQLSAKVDANRAKGNDNADAAKDAHDVAEEAAADLRRQAVCAADSQDYNPNTDQCSTRPNPGVRPLPASPTCSEGGTVTRDGENLVLCDAGKEAHVFVPAVAGLTPSRPAASCAATAAAGLGDGRFYIGTGASVAPTLCRRGDALPEWPHFEAVGGPPVAYYPFENSLQDHISGYDLTAEASKVVRYRDGRVGQAFHFVGNTYLRTPFDSYVFHGPSTVSLWLRLDELDAGGQASLVGHGQGPASNEALHYVIRSLSLYSGFFSNDVSSRPFASPNTWYHIVYVNDALHGRQLYVNGALLVDAGPPAQRYRGVGDLYLGTVSYSTGARMRGAMDEVMIFDRALSRDQVYHLLNNVHHQPPPAALSCDALGSSRFPAAKYFQLTEETPSTVFCGGGSRIAPPGYMLPAVARKAPLFYLGMEGEVRDTIGKVAVNKARGDVTFVPGASGMAVRFPDARSTGPYYDIGLPSSLFTENWTFALFARLGRLGNSGDNVLLCEGTGQPSEALHLTVRDDDLYFGNFADDLRASLTLETGVWYHMAFSMESSRIQRIYLNGQRVAVRTSERPYLGSADSDFGPELGNCPRNPGNSFFGDMDEVMFFDAVLSDAEIAALAGSRTSL